MNSTHRSACSRWKFGFKPGDYPVCEALAARTLGLPFHAQLTERDIDYVCDTLKALL